MREATMNAATVVGSDVARARHRGHEHAADHVLCNLVNLVNAINHRNYANAWVTACELGRAIVRAECVVLGMPLGVERYRAASRLASLRVAAMRALWSAPCPSPLAIAQARSSEPSVDRSVWAFEEQRWLDARESADPLYVAIDSDSSVSLQILPRTIYP
ncbi:MAG: hypothetical protein ACREBE_09225 [bacterium]